MGITYSLNSIALLFRHGDRLCARGQGCVVVASLPQQVQELLGVLGDELRKLGVTGTELLQDRLEHLRLLLDYLSQLLELGVVT